MSCAKAYGAWLGRAAGCLLGKPVEGRCAGQIEGYLKAQGRWPLADYFSNRADEAVRKQFNFQPADNPCYAENITCMVEDDDTNYTATGLAVVEQHGQDFTPADVARFWLGNIPHLPHLHGRARRVPQLVALLVRRRGRTARWTGAFSSATYRNPYREWIGAQIRADFFGYVCPGNAERAAEFAWRDACISHVKNGIYGEMWVAAMLAAAYVIRDDVERVIRAGLGEIPPRQPAARGHRARCSPGASDGRRLLGRPSTASTTAGTRPTATTGATPTPTPRSSRWRCCGARWTSARPSACAVMPGFDTDCNGATAGSVLGLMLGASRLPGEWIAPMNDTLQTGVAGYHEVKLTRMADKTLELIRR